MKKLLSADAATGMVQTAYADGEGGLVIETAQDISDLIERNKASYAQTDENARWGEWAHIGSLPLSVIQDLNRKGLLRGFYIIDQKKFKAWLNDPENRYFRTRPGRI